MNKNMEDFLWYSYFGITKEDAEKDHAKALGKCIDRAYRDMCRTLRYNPDAKSLKDEFKSTVAEEMKNRILHLLQGQYACEWCENCKDKEKCLAEKKALKVSDDEKSRNAFDAWHCSLCHYIVSQAETDAKKQVKDSGHEDVKLFRENGQLTYGQAQKWVNMTLKYMWLMGIWDEEMKSIEPCLHVPVDDYIFKAAKALEINKPKNSWSKWNKYEEYLEYQNKIRKAVKKQSESLIPIQWEAKVWLEQANSANNKSDKNKQEKKESPKER